MDTFPMFLLALPIAAISVTIAKGSVFEGLRTAIGTRNAWLGKLLRCPYCTSHWVSFAVSVLYRPVLVPSGVTAVDVVVSTFALVALATPVSWIVYRSFRQLEPGEDDEAIHLRETLAKARAIIESQRERIEALTSGDGVGS